MPNRKTFILAVLLAIAVAQASCNPSAYGTARTTIHVFQTSLDIGDAIVKAINDPKANQYWPPAKATAEKAADLALKTIDELEKGQGKTDCKTKYPDTSSDSYQTCLQQYQTDVVGLVKETVCLALTALAFIPVQYTSKFQFYLDLGKSFACGTPYPMVLPSSTAPKKTAKPKK